MKRHHAVAVFLLIFGGLFIYLTLDDGETERAIRMGIFFTLLGVFSFFSGRLQPPAQISWSHADCPDYLGGICLSGFHGWGYSECNCTGYPDDFSGSPDAVSRHTIR